MKRHFRRAGPTNPYRLMQPSQKLRRAAERAGINPDDRAAVDAFFMANLSKEKNDVA